MCIANSSLNYFYVYTKKDSIRIESVYGTEAGKVERMIQAGWSLIGIYNEDKMQFMIGGKVMNTLDKSFEIINISHSETQNKND